jgi:large subunit ribosomal protein L18e
LPPSLTSVHSDRTAVVVGTVTDDERVLDMKPGLKIAALRFTEAARARVTAAGGKCMTLDELVMQAPTGTNTLLLRGPYEREARRHFGNIGVPGSHAKPYTRARNSEVKGGVSAHR